MWLIPVIDLARGVAVQARGGDRARYAPVESALTPDAPGDPVALVRAYRAMSGIRECYVADLDAIQGGEPQGRILRDLAAGAAPVALMVDAGVADEASAVALTADGAARAVVGLETLTDFARLDAIVAAVGDDRVVFSLDLRHGRPVAHPDNQEAQRTGADCIGLAARAVAAGVTTLLMLDVGRVGTGGGVDLGLLSALRRRFPAVRLLAGGGIAGRTDLDSIRNTGADGVLVATAFHIGRIGAADIRALAAPAPAQSSARTSR